MQSTFVLLSSPCAVALSIVYFCPHIPGWHTSSKIKTLVWLQSYRSDTLGWPSSSITYSQPITRCQYGSYIITPVSRSHPGPDLKLAPAILTYCTVCCERWHCSTKVKAGVSLLRQHLLETLSPQCDGTVYKTMLSLVGVVLYLVSGVLEWSGGANSSVSSWAKYLWPLASCSVKVPSDELGYLDARTI